METGRAPKGKGEIALYLTLDEALVLDAFFERGDWTGDNNSSIKDQAELRVLWDIEALLERQLLVVNNASYLEELAAARARVRDSTE